LVVKASRLVPPFARAADGTIALRMPDSKVALDLIRALGRPIATSSANMDGGVEATSAADLDEALLARAAMVLDGGKIERSRGASAIIRCVEESPEVLREGGCNENRHC
jgi:tRNA A37 threonylcarbamoyladenosine synthetase subunit TsaC/SUA5/YrdC